MISATPRRGSTKLSPPPAPRAQGATTLRCLGAATWWCRLVTACHVKIRGEVSDGHLCIPPPLGPSVAQSFRSKVQADHVDAWLFLGCVASNMSASCVMLLRNIGLPDISKQPR